MEIKGNVIISCEQGISTGNWMGATVDIDVSPAAKAKRREGVKDLLEEKGLSAEHRRDIEDYIEGKAPWLVFGNTIIDIDTSEIIVIE